MLASGTALGQAIIFLCSPLLTRLYTPTDFGILAVFTALTGILGGIACLRYELAIPLCEKEENATSTFGVCVFACLFLVALTGLWSFLFADQTAVFFNVPELADYFWLLPATLLTVGVKTAFNHLGIRISNIKLISQSQLVLAIGRVLPQLLLGLTGIGAFGLLIGQGVGFAACALFLGFMLFRQIDLKFGPGSFNAMALMAKRYRRFVFFSTPSTLLNGITRLTPAMFLAALYNAEIAGWYGFAQLVIGAPIQLLAMAVAQVYLSRAPRLRESDLPGLRRLFYATSKRLFIVGLFFIGLIAIPGPWAFSLLFGEVWEQSGYITQILALLYLARFIVVPVSQTLNLFERQDLVFLWDFINLIALLGSFAAAKFWSLDYMTAIALYSAGMTASYLFHLFLIVHVLNKHTTKETASTAGPT